MDKKSFFRGFGVGVLFAAIILGISFMVRTSDSFVKSRAKQLGMVYSEQSVSDKVLKDKSEDTSSETKEEDGRQDEAKQADTEEAKNETDNGKKASQKTTKESDESNGQDKKSESEQKKIDMEKEKEKLEKNMNEERAKLTINAGEWSSDVSKKLEEMKIIDSAKEFDKFLEKNGYGDSISAGTYSVSPDDTYQQIAQKITGKAK